MEKKIIKLLSLQLDKLNIEDFDLEAWKSGTNSLLSRFFGESDPRIKQINELKIDYSSWALRDSNSAYNPVASCKKKGQAILEALIDEIQIVGIESHESPLDRAKSHISEERVSDFESAKKRAKVLSDMKKTELIALIQDILE